MESISDMDRVGSSLQRKRNKLKKEVDDSKKIHFYDILLKIIMIIKNHCRTLRPFLEKY